MTALEATSFRARTERGRALLLPGNDLCAEFYRPLCELLAKEGLTTAAVTVPEFLGQKLDRPPTWESLLDRLESLLQEQLATGGILIGHSLGGLLAFLAAARAPRAVAGLVLMEPAIAPWARLARKATRAYVRDVVDRDRDRFVNWTGTFRRVHRPDDYPTWAIDHNLNARRSGDPAVVGALLEALPALYPLPFAKVTVPVLLLRGAHSGWRARLGTRVLSLMLPNARVEVIPRAAHWLANEADADLARAISAFALDLAL